MAYPQNYLPAAFAQTFEAGQLEIAQVLSQQDGQQLLQVVHEHQRQLKGLAPALVAECIDDGPLDRQAVATLLDQGPRAVRQYQFVGELAQTLDYFDQRFLSATEEKKLRKTIRAKGLAVEQAINGLLSHVINEVLFDRQERNAMRRTAQELQRLGVLLEQPRESGVLKSDDTVRRRQFIRQTGWLCLRVYGHVTTDIMRRLLETKQAYYLAGSEEDDGDDLQLNDAINLELSKLKLPARKRSASEQWETAAVVKAFFAKAQWKAWHPRTRSRHDAGLQSAIDHSGLNH